MYYAIKNNINNSWDFTNNTQILFFSKNSVIEKNKPTGVFI